MMISSRPVISWANECREPSPFFVNLLSSGSSGDCTSARWNEFFRNNNNWTQFDIHNKRRSNFWSLSFADKDTSRRELKRQWKLYWNFQLRKQSSALTTRINSHLNTLLRHFSKTFTDTKRPWFQRNIFYLECCCTGNRCHTLFAQNFFSPRCRKQISDSDV